MKLFFCVTSPRSGSTLLTRILNCHSEIASPFEIPIARYFYGLPKESLAIDKTLQICDFYGIDAKRTLEESEYLFNEVLEKEGKSALVVKEPSNTLHLPRIRAEFGAIPVIHIVRDVRQVMGSKAMHSSGFDPEVAANRWFSHNMAVVKYRRLFPQVHTLRYENLTANPEQEIRTLLRFMGYAYEDGMTEYWNFEHTDQKLKMWDGVGPEKSLWAKELSKNRIQAKVRPISDEVARIYERSPRLKQLNEAFGYGD